MILGSHGISRTWRSLLKDLMGVKKFVAGAFAAVYLRMVPFSPTIHPIRSLRKHPP